MSFTFLNEAQVLHFVSLILNNHIYVIFLIQRFLGLNSQYNPSILHTKIAQSCQELVSIEI